MKESPHIAVIGAGWAGLSAAVELTAAGHRVSVFEAAPQPGGRARRVVRHGLSLDNGQHILLGAYSEVLRMIKRLDINEADILLRLPLRLCFPGQLDLATPALPAPFHLLAGLLGAAGLGWSERIAAVGFMMRMRASGFRLAADISVDQLLDGQPDKLVRLLWEPLCLAALNTPTDRASAQVFLNVLRDSFSRARADSDLLLPRQDLSQLLPYAAIRFIQARGGEVRLASPVRPVVAAGVQFLVNGEPFSHVVCAVAPFSLERLLGNLPETQALDELVKKFNYQPIATVYLQYPQTVRLPFPMLGMTGGFTQWVLDRGQLCGQHGLLAVVISAEGPHMKLDHDTLALKVHEELRAMLKNLPDLLWQQVIVEKRATFACIAGLHRPQNFTTHPRLFIAGDYTAGDYPATLEGAVRSGVECARLLQTTLP